MADINTNFGARLRRGREMARAAHKEKEVLKLGVLRAGNSGMMSATGDVASSCHRVAHLRQLGIEIEEPDDSRIIMFQMGTANEAVVFEDLLHTAVEGEVILREEEIPIEWFTSNGTKVTGRPDMVVCKRVEHIINSAGSNQAADSRVIITPIFGIELKSVASVWTSREVLFDGTPKLGHLIQAGHYSWKLGVPFRLSYKQYANQAVPQWAGKFFPKQGMPNSEHIEYNEKGDIKNIKPFEIVYELEWDSSTSKKLRYRREGAAQWVTTLVSQADIERFYEYISTMSSQEKLGPRPLTIDAQGNEKNYSNCNYCALKETCDRAEKKGYVEWLREVKLFTENNK